LHFYSFYDVDGESSDERDEDIMTTCALQASEKCEIDGMTSNQAAYEAVCQN
jgi:hypothetical protein